MINHLNFSPLNNFTFCLNFSENAFSGGRLFICQFRSKVSNQNHRAVNFDLLWAPDY